MAFCTECGTQLPAGARFCPGCGATAAATSSDAANSGSEAGSGASSWAASSATSTPDVPPAAAVPPSYSAPPPSTPPSPPPDAPPRPTSYSQPVQSGGGGGGLAWILPLLIVLAALAIGYTLFAPGRDGPTGKAETASGEKADTTSDEGDTAGQASEDEGRAATASEGSDAGGSRAVDQAAAAADRLGGSVTSAAALDAAFNRDPAGAAALYSGPVRVSGVIASMVQPGPTPALSMEGRTRFNYMIVNFPAGYRTRLAPLAKGQFIQVACRQARGFAGTTVLDDCELD